jgi:hypothetical protein
VTDINPAHPLWEPAAKLYEAWMVSGGLSTLFSETFECAPPKLQLQWLAIAQVAKDLFGPEDVLVTSAEYTSQPVEEDQDLVIDGTRNDLGLVGPSEDRAQEIVDELVDGPVAMLTKSWVDSFPLSTADRLAHARIDALQRETVSQLHELWIALLSELAHTRPSITERQDRFNQLWGYFKGADDKVKREMVADAL